jgi:riboflavin biosynthesis pyrimidine reductase
MAAPRIDRIWPDAASRLGIAALAESYGRPGRAGPAAARPWIRANMVSTIDGSATGADGRSGTISAAGDRAVFGVLRRLCDAVLVAAGTVRDEGYTAMRVDDASVSWRRRAGLADHPVFVIATRSLDLAPESPVFTDAPVRPIVITVASAPVRRRAALAEVAEVVDAGDDELDPMRLRAVLADRGFADVLCEGGPSFLGSLASAGAIDELCLTLSARVELGDGPRIAHGTRLDRGVDMRLVHVLRSGDDLVLRYLRA